MRYDRDMARAVLLACGLASCAFRSGVGAGDAAVDSTVPITCGRLTCDPHATCTNGGAGATCTCATGYAGDGMTCSPVDPCATGNGGCAAACVMTGPGMSACYTPQTCADVAAHVTVPDDSSVTLYAGGDPANPWTARCHGGLEYLMFPPGSTANYGQYSVGGKSTGTNVRTTYAGVRLDPSSFEIDICDQTFATSTGTLSHDPAHNNPPIIVTSMPLGSAMDCVASNSATGVAAIDLTSLPFVVTSGWSTGGNSPGGTATRSGGGRTVAITGGGTCGWNAPSGSPTNPFNTFGNSKLVALQYMP